MYEKLYSNITDSLVENGYIIIENAFEPELSSRLLKSAQSETNFKRAGISGAGNLHLDNDRRRDKIHWLEDKESVQKEFLDFSDGLRHYLNRSLYLGLSYYEAHFAIYDKGDFYETHLDAFRNSKNRVVTTVYYLNEEWSENDGGELIVYDENNKKIATVIPNSNTLVVFMSEKFPHEVLSANRKRYSIAGWFRVDKI